MKKFNLICTFSFLLFSTSIFAETFKAPSKPMRKPGQADSQQCVKFHGDGAKKTFVALFPYTQLKITAIVAEETKTHETNISTENIFCRVYAVNLTNNKKAMESLAKLPADNFQCGYFVASDGILSACSDPE